MKLSEMCDTCKDGVIRLKIRPDATVPKDFILTSKVFDCSFNYCPECGRYIGEQPEKGKDNK